MHNPLSLFMSSDPFFYCASCWLKVLVVPLGPVRTAYYSRVLQLLRKHRPIVLNELDATTLSNTVLIPQAFPQGILLLQFLTHWQSEFVHLEDFQPSKRLYAVKSL